VVLRERSTAEIQKKRLAGVLDSEEPPLSLLTDA
jgi:hypothetical protein